MLRKRARPIGKKLEAVFADALQSLGVASDTKLAVALSGGADSLALASLASAWAKSGSLGLLRRGPSMC